MKKLIFVTAILLITGIAFGQNLQKGNLIGTHTLTITLQPGFTMEQFIDFYKEKLIPEWNKIEPDWKIYVVKSIRGDSKNSFGFIHVVKSEKVRDKYMNDDGSMTEYGKSATEKLNPIFEELGKLGTFTYTYNDWIIQ